MIIAVLLTIAKNWKQPSRGEWINKLLYVHTMEFYSMRKINEFLNLEKTWRNLKYLLLNEIRSMRRLSTV